MASSEREAFLRELPRHFDVLYSYARWLTGGGEDAEDIVHDGVTRAIANWSQYTPGTSMKAWLFTIVKRGYLNRLRRGKIEVTSAGYPENDDRMPAAESAGRPGRLPAQLLRRDIDAALEKMSVEHRSIIILADVEELTLREIGEVEEIPIGTVKSRLWRARSELRARLMDYEGNPE